jgi:hypothetical protein
MSRILEEKLELLEAIDSLLEERKKPYKMDRFSTGIEEKDRERQRIVAPIGGAIGGAAGAHFTDLHKTTSKGTRKKVARTATKISKKLTGSRKYGAKVAKAVLGKKGAMVGMGIAGLPIGYGTQKASEKLSDKYPNISGKTKRQEFNRRLKKS